MKKLFLSLCALSTMFLFSNCIDKDSKLIVEIPDANFKAYLLEHFDTNKDGDISLSEAKTIKEIDCSSRNINTLTGIEKFENLEKLNCANNNLGELELRYNNKLNRLVCTNNNNSMMVYLSMSSPLKNRNFVRPKDNATPEDAILINPIDVSKCIYDDGRTNFLFNFDD